jgi:choline dehydrogenase-like flavoprotein
LRSECGKYTCGVFFRPALTMDNNLSIYKFKSALGASNGMERYKNALSLKIFHPDIIAEIVSHLFGFNIPSRTYNILFIGEQKRGNNSVFYSDKRLKVDWCVTEEEISIYNTMLKKLSGMLSDIADELNIKTDLTEEWLWSAAHHSGTISLGTSPENLVDKDLKLKFCNNVYVCDGSVIQEHSYANTGLAIGQLAMRLADRVLN